MGEWLLPCLVGLFDTRALSLRAFLVRSNPDEQDTGQSKQHRDDERDLDQGHPFFSLHGVTTRRKHTQFVF